jgi:hypothetical protein
MAQRRKSLSENDIRTIVAVWNSLQERCGYNWNELNKFIGSMTLDDMYKLGWKLEDWLDGGKKEWEEWS